jgi:hypothetical protein
MEWLCDNDYKNVSIQNGMGYYDIRGWVGQHHILIARVYEHVPNNIEIHSIAKEKLGSYLISMDRCRKINGII